MVHGLETSPRVCVCVQGGCRARDDRGFFSRVARARAGPAPFFVFVFLVCVFRTVEPAVCFTDR